MGARTHRHHGKQPMQRHYLYAREWGISELIFVDAYDSRREAEASRRHYAANYPEDGMGWPCSYLVSSEPPPEAISWEQLAAAGMEA